MYCVDLCLQNGFPDKDYDCAYLIALLGDRKC